MCASPLEPKKFEFYLITTDHLRQCVKLSTGTALSCGAARRRRAAVLLWLCLWGGSRVLLIE